MLMFMLADVTSYEAGRVRAVTTFCRCAFILASENVMMSYYFDGVKIVIAARR